MFNLRSSVVSIVLASLTLSSAIGARTLSFTVTNEDIVPLLNRMATQTGQTILLEPGAKARVNVSVTDASLEDALDAVTNAAGLKWQKIFTTQSASSDQISASIKALESKPAATVVTTSATGAANAVITGQTASTMASRPFDYGLVPVYWVSAVSKQQTAVNDTNTVTESESAAESKKEEQPRQYTQSEVYASVGQWLNVLPPLQALEVVEQLYDRIMNYLGPGVRAQIQAERDPRNWVPWTPGLMLPPSFTPPNTVIIPPEGYILN